MVNEELMVRITATHLEAVAVALTRILREGDGDGIAVAVGHLRAYLRAEPTLVHACGTGMVAHIVVGRAVLIADAVLDNGIRRAHTLEEIPTVIAVAPCPATDIVVTRSGELLVRKTVRIAAEVGLSARHGLVVEVMMAIHVLDDVVAAFLHLATGVGRAVDIEVLKEV